MDVDKLTLVTIMTILLKKKIITSHELDSLQKLLEDVGELNDETSKKEFINSIWRALK
jgi:hypothetical protein